MDVLFHDLRISIRALLRRPGFTLVAVLTLALGIGATTALFSVVHGVLLRPLPYAQSERIVSLWQTARDNPKKNQFGSVSHPNFLDWKRQAGSLVSMALYSGANYIVTGLGEAEVVQGAIVSPGFFGVFKASPLAGREFTDADDVANGPRVAVVSYGFWTERLGGRSDVIGSALEMSGRSYEIVGVAPPGFGFPRDARIWTPIQNDDKACGRDCVSLNGIARLADGVSVASARQEMQAIAYRLEQAFPGANTNVTVGVATLQEEMVGDVQPALLMLLGAVTMVLLIACANVANLLLVRGAARQAEIAMRAALGAGRARLLRFLLAESLVLAVAGALAGLLMAWWGVDLLKQIAPADIPRLGDVSFNVLTLVFALAIAAVTALLFGLGPAVQLLRTPLVSLLAGRGQVSGRRTRWSRSALLVAEVALSLMLLVGAGLLIRSMVRLQAIDPGFKADRLTIFTIALPASRYAQPADVVRTYDQLSERLSVIPGVQSVARISGLPLSYSEDVQTFARTDQPPPAPGLMPNALYRVVDSAYFRTLAIPILAGRPLEPADRETSQPVIVISRAMADQFWRGEDALGKQIRLGGSPLPKLIVGIAADVHSTTLAAPPQPEMYVPHSQTAKRAMTFVLRSTQPAGQILAAAREAIRGVDAKLPLIRSGTHAALVARELARPHFYLLLLGLFAGLAVALTAVGIYGVAAYAVAQRTREIGVRMALGADTLTVLRLVIWEGLRPAIIGVAVGSAGAIAGGRIMSRLLFEVQPRDPVTMAAVVGAILLVVTLACVIPARRATRIPPAAALRFE
jgi:putative ABC transport system permease protein